MTKLEIPFSEAETVVSTPAYAVARPIGKLSAQATAHLLGPNPGYYAPRPTLAESFSEDDMTPAEIETVNVITEPAVSTFITPAEPHFDQDAFLFGSNPAHYSVAASKVDTITPQFSHH